MSEALDSVCKLPTVAEPKTVNIDSEPKGHSLASIICGIFLIRKKISWKCPIGLPKCVYFRLVTDDLIWAKRPLNFSEADFKSNYIPGFNPSDKCSYQVTVPSMTEPEARPDDPWPWSEELSDELL